MTRHNPQQAAAVLDVLKQAVALLEQTTIQSQAEQNAQSSEEWAQTAELAKSLVALRQFLRQAVADRPDLRTAVEYLAKWIGAIVEHAPSPDEAAADVVGMPEARGPSVGATADLDQQASAEPPPLPRQQVPLSIGGASTIIDVPGTSDEAQAAKLAAERAAERSRNEGWSASPSAPIAAPQPQFDIALIAERCAIKAEGCEWAARYRDVWENEPNDTALRKATYENIVNRARALPNCYVWALNPKVIVPGFARMTQYAQAFRNLAAAAELAYSIKRDGPHGGEWLQESYMLLAEAQSAIRAALDVDGLYADNDQEEAFRWLRQRTGEDRILVPRYMKLEDPADLADAENLAVRISDLRERLTVVRQQGSQKRSMLSKAKYHARLLRENQSHDPMIDWRKMVDAIDGAVNLGIPPSDIEVRDIIAPLVDQVPEGLELPANVQRAMEAVDAYLATREAEAAASSEPVRPRTLAPEVAEVAALLEGRVAVLIGGEMRSQAKRALERDLHLAELRWIPAAHHQSHYMFESAVARPDTAVVMLAIRWASHSFENVDELCRKYGKPYVRLPGGYSPNQVARQILEQVGDALRRNTPRPATAK